MAQAPARPRPNREFDVLGIGCTAVDDILYVPTYPPADGKVEVRQRERHCGGLCATALVAAARLGGSCAYAGALGDDEGSRFVRTTLETEGVDCRHVVAKPGTGPVRSVIVVDESKRTRNIFYDTHGALGAHPRQPDRSLIERSRVLLVDRFGIPGMIRAARLARAAGRAVVADFESSHLPRFAELLALPDHLILSRDFALRLTGTRRVETAAHQLWNEGRAVVIITGGQEGCWVLDRARGPIRHQPAFKVDAVDTTGCGDVFHGAYAFGLARGLDLPARLDLASAAAALKATRHGGQSGAPDHRQVARFLNARPTA